MCLSPSMSAARQHMWGVSPEGPYHQAKSGSPHDRVEHVRTHERGSAVYRDAGGCCLLKSQASARHWIVSAGRCERIQFQAGCGQVIAMCVIRWQFDGLAMQGWDMFLNETKAEPNMVVFASALWDVARCAGSTEASGV